jgi:hypothetical protein
MAGTNGSYSNGNGLSISLPPPIESDEQAKPLGDSPVAAEAEATEPEAEKPWYEPERRTRRRSTN